MNRAELRTAALERSGGACEWPGCTSTVRLELAHLEGVGMGGRPSADRLDNVAILCGEHHDLLDGRSHAGLRREMGILLRSVILLRSPWMLEPGDADE